MIKLPVINRWFGEFVHVRVHKNTYGIHVGLYCWPFRRLCAMCVAFSPFHVVHMWGCIEGSAVLNGEVGRVVLVCVCVVCLLVRACAFLSVCPCVGVSGYVCLCVREDKEQRGRVKLNMSALQNRTDEASNYQCFFFLKKRNNKTFFFSKAYFTEYD